MNANRQWELLESRGRLEGELRRLAEERERVLAIAPRGAQVPGAPRMAHEVAGPGHEMSQTGVRNVLLWTGASLLAFSGLGFGGYEWSRLGPVGRSIVLAIVTALVLAAALVARRRLPMTAEAIAATGVALALVDWGLLRRAGVGAALAPPAWWAIGMCVLGVLGAALAARALTTGRVTTALAFLAVVPLAVGTAVPLAHTRPGVGIAPCLSGLAVLDLVVARLAWRGSWRLGACVVWCGAVALSVWADLDALGSLGVARHGPSLAVAALAIAATGCAPLAMRILFGSLPSRQASADELAFWPAASEDAAATMTGAASGSVAAALLYGLAGAGFGPWYFAVALLLGLLVLRAADLLRGQDAWGVRAVGLAVTGLGAIGAIAEGLMAGTSWEGTAVFGVCTLLLCAAPLLRATVTTELRALSAVVVGLGTLPAIVESIFGLVGPLHWWLHGWTGSLALPATHVGPTTTLRTHAVPTTMVGLGLLALVAATLHTPGRPRLPRRIAGLVVLAVGTLLVGDAPFAIGLRIGGTIVLELTAGSVAVVAAIVLSRVHGVRRAAPMFLAVAGALGVCCLGWCASTPTGTEVGIGVVLAWAGAVAACWRRAALGDVARGAVVVLALSLVGCVMAGSRSTTSATGTAVVVAAACLLLVAREPIVTGRDRYETCLGASEVVALMGLAVPILTPTLTPIWSARAVDVTVAVIGLGAAAVRPGRRGYRYAAALGSVAALWCWLGSAHVRLIEAYTWPAAAVLLALGAVARPEPARREVPRSWFAFGPGLLLALWPTTELGVTRPDALRLGCVTALGVASVVVGAKGRLQAPLVMGVATLLVVAVHVSLPVLRGLPTWLLAGVAGAALLGLGATAERSIAAARRALERLGRLG